MCVYVREREGETETESIYTVREKSISSKMVRNMLEIKILLLLLFLSAHYSHVYSSTHTNTHTHTTQTVCQTWFTSHFHIFVYTHYTFVLFFSDLTLIPSDSCTCWSLSASTLFSVCFLLLRVRHTFSLPPLDSSVPPACLWAAMELCIKWKVFLLVF